MSRPSASTRPLVISRPTRPSSPQAFQSSPPSNAPSRPDRSAYRAPANHPTSDSASYSRPSRETRDRDRNNSISTVRSDASLQRNGGPSINTGAVRPPRNRPNRSGTVGTVSSDGDGESPASLGNVLSAFATAGRKKTLDNDEEWDRMRQEELEAERRRQQRIRDKVPGRRTNGRAKAGDIDGMPHSPHNLWRALGLIVLCSHLGRNQGRVGICYRSRRELCQHEASYIIELSSCQFNPVELALQLLDDASSGQGMASFRQTKKMLSHALKGSVDSMWRARDHDGQHPDFM